MLVRLTLLRPAASAFAAPRLLCHAFCGAIQAIHATLRNPSIAGSLWGDRLFKLVHFPRPELAQRQAASQAQQAILQLQQSQAVQAIHPPQTHLSRKPCTISEREPKPGYMQLQAMQVVLTVPSPAASPFPQPLLQTPLPLVQQGISKQRNFHHSPGTTPAARASPKERKTFALLTCIPLSA